MSRTAITVEIGNSADAYISESPRNACPATLILDTGSVELTLTFTSDAGSAVRGRVGQAVLDWGESLAEMSVSPP